jgi:MFS family permease
MSSRERVVTPATLSGFGFLSVPRISLTRLEWAVCAVACVGFAFDTYEFVVTSLIVRPALLALQQAPTGSAPFNRAAGLLFYVPLAAAGICGLLGGYLTDRFGRRRVLVWSILIYGAAAVLSARASSVLDLLVWRSVAVTGAAVEFVAAIAWLAELFPDARRRESVLAYTQAGSAAGGLLLTVAYYVAVTYGGSLPAIRGAHEAWRYTLLFGLAPAIPLMLIRPLLPESPVWRSKKMLGVLKRPSVKALFNPALRKTTVVAALLTACGYAAAYGAVQQIPRIVPGLSQVRHLPVLAQEQAVSAVHLFSDLGNIVGRVLFALLVVRISGDRRQLRYFVIPALAVFPIVYLVAAQSSIDALKAGTFVVTVLVTAQLSFWGNYLPKVYPTHLRGTGESLATNVGGRVLGTSAALATTTLANVMPGNPSMQLAYASALVGTVASLAAFIGSFSLPEAGRAQLPD